MEEGRERGRLVMGDQRDPMSQDDRTKILSPTQGKQNGGGERWEGGRNERGWADQRTLD